ncbi:MAG: PIG-L family deacetylase [Clostridia bacterium]|nr:PIG-L family deacetylase [Clostridia bacterium]
MRNRFFVWLACLGLMLVVPLWGLAAATNCPPSFAAVGVNRLKTTLPVYQKSSSGSAELTRIPAGKSCQILGRSGSFYLVKYNGKTGYADQKNMAVQGKASYTALPEMPQENLSLKDYLPKNANGKNITLQGTIHADQKIDHLFVYLWDERSMSAERVYIISLSTPRNTIDTAKLQSQLSLNGVSGGRKTLVVQASVGDQQYTLYRTVLSVRGTVKYPSSITGQCRVSSKEAADSDWRTSWSPTKQKPALTVDIPSGAHPTLLTMEWKVRPASFTVELYGENQRLLSKETKKTGFFCDQYPLSEDVRRIRLTVTGKKCALGTLRVYGPTYDTTSVQQWKPVPDHVDILFFSTHEDDELLFFGGGIPAYCARGVKVAVAYATDNGRTRYKEAMDGLWAAGLKYHPIFLGWHNFKAPSVKAALGDWHKYSGDVQKKLVRMIRQYKPKVVITQGFDGEYGHNQHKAGVQLMAKAIDLANDPTYDPDSVQQYGTWQIQKMYAHRYGKNRITMNWNQALDETGVITPMFLAKEAFDRHQSQHGGFSMEVHSKKYDCRQFGLYHTTVGPDVQKNDFLENIQLD